MKAHAPITAEQTASEAFAAILRHNLDSLHAWQGTARDWQDIEGVHQVRVSFRRLRSAFSVFRPILARDIDVLIDEGLPAFHDHRPDMAALAGTAMLAILEARREDAYARVRGMLDSEAFAAFNRDFVAWVDAAGWRVGGLARKKRERQDGDVVALARHLLGKQDLEVLAHGDGIENHDAEEMHRLRIECKKLRYAAEFFFVTFDGMKDFLKHMKGLQDTLGLMNDAAVMQGMMDDLVPADAGADLGRYADELIDWRAEQYAAKEALLGGQWTEFLEAERPWTEPAGPRDIHEDPDC